MQNGIEIRAHILNFRNLNPTTHETIIGITIDRLVAYLQRK